MHIQEGDPMDCVTQPAIQYFMPKQSGDPTEYTNTDSRSDGLHIHRMDIRWPMHAHPGDLIECAYTAWNCDGLCINRTEI